MNKLDKNINKAKFAELVGKVNVREDKAEYFKKYLKIKDRDSTKIIPFTINDSQKELKAIIDKWDKGTDKRTLFIIILKARRHGFSTYVEADYFTRIKHEKNKVAMIISYDDPSSNEINKMTDIFYRHLPQGHKPLRRASRGNGLKLENPKFDFLLPISPDNDPGLQSEFLIETAGNPNAASGYNINYLHISELAKWSGDIKATMTSMLPAIPLYNSIVIVESTAKGYNYFKELWDNSNEYNNVNGKRVKKNDYIPLFIPWFDDNRCVLPYTGFELTRRNHPMWGNEFEIFKTHKVSYEQLEWRRWCIRKLETLEEFQQEFPASPEEAFIATGSSVFNNGKVKARLDHLREYYKNKLDEDGKPKFTTGEFEFKWKVDRTIDDSTIKFIPDEHGIIMIYEEPKQSYPYFIGGDTAGEGSNYFAAHVIDNSTGKEVATYHCQHDSDLFAYQMYCLGIYYNEAMIAIEMNFDPSPINRLQDLFYWNLYTREVYDSTEDKPTKKVGFQTNSRTRELVISRLIEVVRDNIEWISDIETLKEMLEFVKSKTGKKEANAGKQDDLVISLAITYGCADQMWTSVEVIEEDEEEEELDEDDIDANEENWMAD